MVYLDGILPFVALCTFASLDMTSSTCYLHSEKSYDYSKEILVYFITVLAAFIPATLLARRSEFCEM